MALRPPRKCSAAGAGIVSFGVAVATERRNPKWSTKIGLLQPSLPVMVAIGGTSSAWNVIPTGALGVTPSRLVVKSRCQ
jgi:hypothetical protein